MDSAEQISKDNLAAAKNSGVVKTVKIYTAQDEDICKSCKPWHGKVFSIGKANFEKNIPPFIFCKNPKRFSYQTKNGCRCYWRPEEISLEY